MAKDAVDKKTKDIFGARQGVKGRPKTGTAMTAAEKQAKYRANKQLVNLSVMIPVAEKYILDKWVLQTGKTQSDIISTMIRLQSEII